MTYQALIVDDNPLNSDVLTQLLKREGVSAAAVPRPSLINETLDQVGHIDVVFLDFEFPNHSGLELISELRADSRLSGAIFVAYTVHISELNEARMAGFDSFLGKPLIPEKFPDQISRILAGERVWDVGQ